MKSTGSTNHLSEYDSEASFLSCSPRCLLPNAHTLEGQGSTHTQHGEHSDIRPLARTICTGIYSAHKSGSVYYSPLLLPDHIPGSFLPERTTVSIYGLVYPPQDHRRIHPRRAYLKEVMNKNTQWSDRPQSIPFTGSAIFFDPRHSSPNHSRTRHTSPILAMPMPAAPHRAQPAVYCPPRLASLRPAAPCQTLPNSALPPHATDRLEQQLDRLQRSLS